ncbi:MAG: hypothetical protein ACTHMC_24960 [Pseudobacter sp.]|uniref:hypothetical protein n=1 Tax=Pseudobacter sp. TaxID=2045420 RepID=UPI003F8101B9
MNTILGSGIVIGLIFLVTAMYFKSSYRRKSRNREIFVRIKPLLDKLENNEPVSPATVFPFAADIRTRQMTYALLAEFERLDLFPEEYNTLIKSAEGQLANWLEYPTELDACPDEMEYIKRVTLDFDGQHNFVHYEVFKYRVNEPHWAAEDGWMLGVVGPYFDDSNPYDHARATFSRTSSTVDKVSPEEEAKWVHDNISMRG